VRQRDGVAVVGLTDYALQQLGDIVFVELPKVGAHFMAGEAFGTVESVKAVSEMYAPVTGQVVKVNEEINVSTENNNHDPYGAGWLIEIRMDNTTQAKQLLTPTEYTTYLEDNTDR
jgi:glycine cleavage system H protein